MNHFAKRFILLLLCLGFAIVPDGCNRRQDTATRGRMIVFVSIPPQKYLAERIAGSHARVTALVDQAQDPHVFSPSPRRMVALEQARVFFTVGMPFEITLVRKIQEQNKNLRVVATDKGLPKRRLSAGEIDPRDHDAVAGEIDPHVWTSPRNARRMAAIMAREFIRLDPARKSDYQKNAAALDASLAALDAKIAARLKPFAGDTFFVYHPAFGYFGDDYGLKQVAVESAGKEPTSARLALLVRQARAKRARIIFVTPQFSRKSAERLALEIRGTVVAVDPMAEDYIANLERVARAIAGGVVK